MNCTVCCQTTWSAYALTRDMYTGKFYRLLSCDTCGVIRTADEETLPSSHLYMYDGSFDAGERFGPIQWLVRAFRKARTYGLEPKNPGRVLDVGCGDGSFLLALQRQGWDVFGSELSDTIATTAKTHLGNRISIGTIEELRFAEASFDLITFWHVLEHLDDPGHAIRIARRLLKADGQIVVAVPNISSWQAHIFKEDWLHLDVPRHRWHFSPHTLSALAGRSHLQVHDIRHFSLEYGPFAILQGIATKIGLGHTFFTKLMRLPPSKLVREPLFWAHMPLLIFAAVPSLFIELIAALCGRGGALVLVLRPRQ